MRPESEEPKAPETQPAEAPNQPEPEKPDDKRTIILKVCGLCLWASAEDQTKAWSMADPDVEVQWIPMCEACQADLWAEIPNFGRFAGRLRANLGVRIFDFFGADENEVLAVFNTWMQCIAQLWAATILRQTTLQGQQLGAMLVGGAGKRGPGGFPGPVMPGA